MIKRYFKDSFAFIANHIKRHNILMIIASSIVTAMALVFSLYWIFDTNDISNFIDGLYLAGNLFFLFISTALLAVLIIFRHVKFKENVLAIIVHVYVLLLVVWDTLICIIDLKYGYSPIAYLLVITLVTGLFVIEPLFFGTLILSSAITVIVVAVNDKTPFFTGYAETENTIYFIVYFVAILLVGLEHYGITLRDYHIEKRLEQMTYYDDLTGLLNERSYLKDIEEIDKLVQEGKLTEYAVILMDLNNLKATNDAYGHRFGCHLVVRCGHTLPIYFKTSKLFHVGGDEYVAIVLDEDYRDFDNVFKKFSEDLSYSLVEFDGRELIFSVAHGYAKYEAGMKYKDVLQKADVAMYANKKMLKEKYGMKGR